MYSVYFIIFESKKENCMSQNTEHYVGIHQQKHIFLLLQ